MADDNKLLPIKRVIAAQEDFHKNPRGGGGFDPLVDVDSQFIASRIAEIKGVDRALNRTAKEWPDTPTVAVVKLRKDAIAKSKRPSDIFNDRTCPIIGGGGLGTLYISVTKRGL